MSWQCPPVHVVPASEWAKIKTVRVGQSGLLKDEIWEENEDIKLLRSYGGVFVNDAFLKLWNHTNGLLFLDGGYGSSKTTYAITRLLVKCRQNKYFKCFYGRQKKTEARQLHANIITEIERNGWNDEFDYSTKPNGTTTIIHNPTGNRFEMFGCDDVDSLKGWNNPTDILIDEVNQISFASFGMMWTRLRTPGCELLLIACFNNCDVYEGHWLLKYIYKHETGEKNSENEALLESLAGANLLTHHSVYTDNLFQNPAAYYDKLVIKANGDLVKIKQYCDGAWGVNLDAQPYYKRFNANEIVVNNEEIPYDPQFPLWISWDENVNPYLPVIIGQIPTGTNELRIIDEIAAKNPFNYLEWVCDEIKSRYPFHVAGVMICGDATSKKEDVKIEKGKNFFTLIMGYLKNMFPRLRTQESNPNNAIRGNFINTVFAMNYQGIKVKIAKRCVNLISDLQNCPEAPDGSGKSKQKKTIDGVRGVQEWGHFGDCFDYLICEAFNWAYILFQSAGVSMPVTGGGKIVNNAMEATDMSKVFPHRKISKKPVHNPNAVIYEEGDEGYVPISYGKRKSSNSMR